MSGEQLCSYCRTEPAYPRDDYCSATCSRLANGVPLTAGERLTPAQRNRKNSIPLSEWRRQVRAEKALYDLAFGDLPRCIECGWRMAPRKSRKTGEPARHCSDTCYQRGYQRRLRANRTPEEREEWRAWNRERMRERRQRELGREEPDGLVVVDRLSLWKGRPADRHEHREMWPRS